MRRCSKKSRKVKRSRQLFKLQSLTERAKMETLSTVFEHGWSSSLETSMKSLWNDTLSSLSYRKDYSAWDILTYHSFQKSALTCSWANKSKMKGSVDLTNTCENLSTGKTRVTHNRLSSFSICFRRALRSSTTSRSWLSRGVKHNVSLLVAAFSWRLITSTYSPLLIQVRRYRDSRYLHSARQVSFKTATD